MLVRQEIGGLLIVCNLLREEMRQMAQALEVPPQRVSFQWAALAIVKPARRKRSYPRQVKPRAAKYPTKKCQPA